MMTKNYDDLTPFEQARIRAAAFGDGLVLTAASISWLDAWEEAEDLPSEVRDMHAYAYLEAMLPFSQQLIVSGTIA